MFRKEAKILNSFGIHARPAGMIASVASTFESDIKLIKDRMEVNAKSIMGILSLAAGKGTRIIIEARGKDEKEAVSAIAEIFEKKFDLE
ncbi:MAG: HPr family phosphocarrier protein [Elusimicrobia bacterium]|nr:HPr family phosphocarrier protein [Elusimicrobiota bacterium]